MKNTAVLSRFGQYVGSTALAMAIVYGIVYASHKFLGDASYGILGVFSCFLLGFLYAMAKSDVEGKEREARWAEEDRARETKPKMLME
tara:strand:+ start:259 stop:522 length:264 start_codon:yes stop_codon:yes gene_type:complete